MDTSSLATSAAAPAPAGSPDETPLEARERAEAALAGENRILEMIARGDSLGSVLEALCGLVEQTSQDSLCSILLLDASGERLSFGAAPRLPKGFTKAFDGRTVADGWGPCGLAALRKEPVILADITLDSPCADYRDLALNHGLQSCWSTPILTAEAKALGTVAVYSREPRSPTARQRELIKQFAHLASVGIERARGEAALRRSQAYLAEAQKLSQTGSFGWNIATGELVWSAETFCILGYEPGTKPTLELVRQRVHPEDRALVQQMTEHALRGGTSLDFEHRLLMPDGSVKHVHVVAHRAAGECGAVEFVGAVKDVTSKHRTHESLASAFKEMQALRDQFRLAIDAIPGQVWSALPDGQVDFLNRRWREYTGLTQEQAGGWGWRKAIHPQDLAGLEAYWRGMLACGQAGETEVRLRRADGVYRWFLFRAVPLYDGAGKRVRWYGQNTDIDERKGAEALVAGEKRLLEMIARGDQLTAILEASCRFAEEVCGDVLVSILLVSSDGKSLRHGAAPSLPKDYTQAIDGGLIGPRAGSCGTAAYRKEAVIVADIATDPLWADYRHLALAHSLKSCWSTPIFSTSQEVMGTFALYSHEPGNPTVAQRNIVEQITHLAAVALERQRAEEALRRSEARFEGILEIAEDAIISVDAAQQIVLFNQGAEKAFGYTQAEVMGKSLELLLPQRFASAHQAHLRAFADSPEVARPMGQRREVFGMRKNGQEFPAEASISKLDLGGELLFTVILRDITERKEAAEALRASAQLARGQAEALSRTLGALARESAADRLVEHVLRTIIEQLGAHSSSVWLRGEAAGRVGFEFALENGKLLTKADAALSRISLTLRIDEVWPWPEVFRTGKPGVLEDIREGPDFPWRAHVLALGVVTILIVPMLIAGEVQGVIGIRFTCRRAFRTEELELAQALSHQAMLAVQLMRLSQQSRQAAVVAERNRLARDIHDTLAQGFTGVIVQLEAAADAMSDGALSEADQHVARASQLARGSLQEARRSVRALRPQALERGDLCAAMAELLKEMTTGTDLRAEFVLQGEPRPLPPQWDENLLRIGQEVLTNSLRHAQAREFEAQVSFGAEALHLTLRDNGRGFDPGAKHDGFGLQGMRERADAMGGELLIQSRPGTGTLVHLTLPYPDPPPDPDL